MPKNLDARLDRIEATVGAVATSAAKVRAALAAHEETGTLPTHPDLRAIVVHIIASLIEMDRRSGGEIG